MERLALFVTCLAELFAPQIAEQAATLVAHRAGAEVVLIGEGCCGQPAWNAGYADEARTLARRLIPRLEGYTAVVVPSGSCATMLLRYYPHLFPPDSPMGRAAEDLAARTHELAAFLAALLPREDGGPAPTNTDGTIAFHPSCHSLRGARVGDAGEHCLVAAGCTLTRQQWSDECCGFGGLFAVKQEPLSTAMADTKLNSLMASGAETVVSGELGCLLHLEGRARRRGLSLRFCHLAEWLAKADQPPEPHG